MGAKRGRAELEAPVGRLARCSAEQVPVALHWCCCNMTVGYQLREAHLCGAVDGEAGGRCCLKHARQGAGGGGVGGVGIRGRHGPIPQHLERDRCGHQ